MYMRVVDLRSSYLPSSLSPSFLPPSSLLPSSLPLTHCFPHSLKRKRPVYEEPTYSDFDEEEDEEEEDEDEDDDEVEEGATGATSDAEYSPSEDEAELPPSPRSMKLGSTPASDTQAMEVTQQTEGVSQSREKKETTTFPVACA